MSTPAEQPRPKYGEYATPEQQRALRGVPIEPAAPAGAPVVPTAYGTPVAERPQSGASVRRKPRIWDLVVTIGLLAYGLFTVFTSGVQYLDPADVMNATMQMLGIEGEFTNIAAGRAWGTAAAAVLAIGWALTAWFSIRMLRRGRIAFWVPIVGGVVFTLIASICLTIPMMSDPAFIEYLGSMQP